MDVKYIDSSFFQFTQIIFFLGPRTAIIIGPKDEIIDRHTYNFATYMGLRLELNGGGGGLFLKYFLILRSTQTYCVDIHAFFLLENEHFSKKSSHQ